MATYTLKAGTAYFNFSPFGLIFMAQKFLNGARPIVAAEAAAGSGWHPVGKYLACHSIELSLKAFLALKGRDLKSLKDRFGHKIDSVLAEANRLGLAERVTLTPDEQAEIQKAAKYYYGKIFEYPALLEAVQAYPGDPNASILLSAAEKLVDGLYLPCKLAA